LGVLAHFYGHAKRSAIKLFGGAGGNGPQEIGETVLLNRIVAKGFESGCGACLAQANSVPCY
jgi:hypothetical protein